MEIDPCNIKYALISHFTKIMHAYIIVLFNVMFIMLNLLNSSILTFSTTFDYTDAKVGL